MTFSGATSRGWALFGLLGVMAVQLVYYQAIERIPIGVALVIEYTAPLPSSATGARGRHVGLGLWLAETSTSAATSSSARSTRSSAR